MPPSATLAPPALPAEPLSSAPPVLVQADSMTARLLKLAGTKASDMPRTPSERSLLDAPAATRDGKVVGLREIRNRDGSLERRVYGLRDANPHFAYELVSEAEIGRGGRWSSGWVPVHRSNEGGANCDPNEFDADGLCRRGSCVWAYAVAEHASKQDASAFKRTQNLVLGTMPRTAENPVGDKAARGGAGSTVQRFAGKLTGEVLGEVD